MIDLHHTTLISSRQQAATPIPAGFPAHADQIQIPTTALDSEQASQQEQQQALLLEMLTEDRREEEDGLAATVGSEAIAGEPRIIVTRKVSLTVDGNFERFSIGSNKIKIVAFSKTKLISSCDKNCLWIRRN